jgi:peptidoglycan/LPS O-acetylase OafA/YrhL
LRDDRLTGLDLLRALACLLVFAHHCVQRLDFNALTGAWRPFYLFFNLGAFGVAIFFLLSGFLLTRPFWMAFDAGAPMPSLKTYALRRAARIVPGYYAALTVSLVVAAVCFGTAFSPEILIRYVAGLLFISEFHWLTLFPVEVNGPLWSIGMEVASYALLPLGLWALFGCRRLLPGWRGRLVFVEFFGLALVGHALIVLLVPKETVGASFDYGMLGGAKYWMPEFNVLGFFAVFALGGLAAGISVLWRGKRNGLADLLVIGGLAGAAVAMGLASGPRQPEAFGWLDMPYAFPGFHLGVAVALIAFPHAKYLPALSEARPIRYFAKISFGLYIWHFLILELLRQQFARDFAYAGIADTSRWMELVAVSFVLAVIAGSLSWYGLEAPGLAWAKRRERHPPDPLSARSVHA